MHWPVVQRNRDAFGFGIALLDQAEVAIHLLDVEATALPGDHHTRVDLDAGSDAPLLSRRRLPRQLGASSTWGIRPADAGPQFVSHLVLIQERKALGIGLTALASLRNHREFLVIGQVGRMHAGASALVDDVQAAQQFAHAR
jgi:hypothetical protein